MAALMARLPSKTPRDNGAARNRFHKPALPLLQQSDADVDPKEQDELHHHPGEGMSVAVVVRVAPRGDCLLARGERHGQTTRKTAVAVLAGLLIPAVHALQQILQSLLIRSRQIRNLLHLREGIFHHRASSWPREHFFADRLHDIARQDSCHHGALGGVRRIEEHADLRFLLRAEKGAPGVLTEIRRNDHGHCGVPLRTAARASSGLEGLHLERLFSREPFHDVAGNRAAILVHRQDRNFTLGRVALRLLIRIRKRTR